MNKQTLALQIKKTIDEFNVVVDEVEKNDDGVFDITFEETTHTLYLLNELLEKMSLRREEAFQYLLNNPDTEKVVGYHCMYKLGDLNGDKVLLEENGNKEKIHKDYISKKKKKYIKMKFNK